MAAEINPFEIAKAQIDAAAKKLKLDPGLTEILKNPMRMLTVSLPVKMRNGKVQVFTGYRCQYNDFRGPTKGSIRYSPDLTPESIMAVACWMTWKCAVINIPYGGAEGGIVCNPKDLKDFELEALTRRYAYALREFIGPEKDIPMPDATTNPQTMAWFMDTYSTLNGTAKPAVITGKPVEVGGSMGSAQAPARGCVITIREAAYALGMDLTKATVAIQGATDEGVAAAGLLQDLGATIIAVSDSGGGVYNPNGLDIKEIIKYKSLKKNKTGSVKGFPGSKPVTHDKLLEMKCDILVQSGNDLLITKANAKKIKAKIIAEASNGLITPEADEILHKSNIFVIPDILANAGGITHSYFEWAQNIEGVYWSEDEVNQKLEKQMVNAFRDVYEVHRKSKVDLRTAAYMLAIERVAKVFEIRGLWP